MMSPESADTLIQQLFDIGLTLQSTATLLAGPAAEQLGGLIGELDEIIRLVRVGVFEQATIRRPPTETFEVPHPLIPERLQAVWVAVDRLRANVEVDPAVAPGVRARLAEAARLLTSGLTGDPGW